MIVGPDAESEQWAGRIAKHARCPYIVLTKHRLGDRRVALHLPDLSAIHDRKPVLVDDIISSAGTMIETARSLIAAGMPKPVCIGIHGLFGDDSFKMLSEVAERIVTTNTINHRSNSIDLSEQIATAVAAILTA